MKTKAKYVGLDVHKDTTVIVVADGGRSAGGPKMTRWPLSPDPLWRRARRAARGSFAFPRRIGHSIDQNRAVTLRPRVGLRVS